MLGQGGAGPSCLCLDFLPSLDWLTSNSSHSHFFPEGFLSKQLEQESTPWTLLGRTLDISHLWCLLHWIGFILWLFSYGHQHRPSRLQTTLSSHKGENLFPDRQLSNPTIGFHWPVSHMSMCWGEVEPNCSWVNRSEATTARRRANNRKWLVGLWILTKESEVTHSNSRQSPSSQGGENLSHCLLALKSHDLLVLPSESVGQVLPGWGQCESREKSRKELPGATFRPL